MRDRLGDFWAASLALAVALVAAPAHAGDFLVDPGTSDFVVKDDTGAVDQLRVHGVDGTISRQGASFVHFGIGANNLYVGQSAGNPASAGSSNTAFGKDALASSTGSANTALGMEALEANTTGSSNSALGQGALRANTTGSFNSAFGRWALLSNATGSRNSAGGQNALRLNADGSDNSAFGVASLYANVSGSFNSAFGYRTLATHTGSYSSAFGADALAVSDGTEPNDAFGRQALTANTSGGGNAAFGHGALLANDTLSGNSVFGHDAMRSALGKEIVLPGDEYNPPVYAYGGDDSIVFGQGALATATTDVGDAIAFGQYVAGAGDFVGVAFGAEAFSQAHAGGIGFGFQTLASSQLANNIAIGAEAGSNSNTATDNIYIGHIGNPTESARIRIGTSGTQTDAKITGIFGATASAGVAMTVQPDGRLLGPPSSERFKRDVRDLEDASDVLAALRPVVFRYREAEPDGERPRQYGLIAEEVAQVAPDLVATDADGRPYSVRYQKLAPLLLAELKDQFDVAREQEHTIAALSERVRKLRHVVAVTEAGR
jgi:hypothetical protein